MSKCENCISQNVCRWWQNGDGKNNLNCTNEVVCPEYKDKSLCVELPCKVGDTLYIIEDKEICEVIVNMFQFDKYGNYVVLENDDLWFDTYSIDKLGKYYFLTEEEAELKLKEMGE